VRGPVTVIPSGIVLTLATSRMLGNTAADQATFTEFAVDEVELAEDHTVILWIRQDDMTALKAEAEEAATPKDIWRE